MNPKKETKKREHNYGGLFRELDKECQRLGAHGY